MSLIELKSYFVYLKLDINCCIIFDYFSWLRSFIFFTKSRWFENGFSSELRKFSFTNCRQKKKRTRKCETTLCYTCAGTQIKQIAKTFSIQQFLYIYWYWAVYENFLLKNKYFPYKIHITYGICIILWNIMFKINKHKNKYIEINRNLHSSWRTLILLSLVTRFIPADRISDCPLRHNTVSFENGAIITHVRRASLPSVTMDGPPVPNTKFKIGTIVEFCLMIIKL